MANAVEMLAWGRRWAMVLAALAAGHLGLVGGAAQTNPLCTVSIQALSDAAELGAVPGSFQVTRTAPLDQALDVEYQISGTATNLVD